MQLKIISLKIDLNNIINHVFGKHSECAKIGYFCGLQKENGENYFTIEKIWTIWKVTELKYISWNEKSLLQNEESNRVETFNFIILKYIGGKRINFDLRGSYETYHMKIVMLQ